MASLKDIARELNISVSLVSKVLNGRLGNTGVREGLSEAIRQQAEKMGYRKNRSALALLKNRQDVVGVFLHREGRLGSGLMEELIEGISEAATAQGRRLLLGFFHSASGFEELCKMAHRGTMDGLLVGGITHPELTPTLRAIAQTGLPVVTIMQRHLHASLPNVAVDQVEIGRLGTQHLIEAGCRHIGHIRDFQERFQGYRQALREAGLPYRAPMVYGNTLDFGYAKGQAAARHFLEKGIALDGLFAQGDEEAVGAMNVFCDAGLKVPEDIRLVGVDNAPYAEFSRTPLSSVSQSSRERGACAMRLLLDLLEEKPVSSAVVAPRLVVRASSRKG